MAFVCRTFLLTFVLVAAAAAPAAASPVLVFDDGRVTIEDDPYLPPRAATELPAPPRGQVPPALRLAGAAQAASVRTAVQKAYSTGRIGAAKRDRFLAIYDEAITTSRRLRGRCRSQLVNVIATLQRIATGRNLTASRMPALFEQLRRNTEFWRSYPAVGVGDRVRFDFGVIYEHYRGQGIQIQPLASFGKANGVYNACVGVDTPKEAHCPITSFRRLLSGMAAITARRGGFNAWEYYFYFGGGRPPWISGMAQATGVQAFARGAKLLRRPYYLRLARSALGAFRTRPPVGVRVPAAGGSHYLQYSYAPRLRILNAFAQTVIGLFDYTKVSRDPLGRALMRSGDRALRRAIPVADTGRWTTYSYPGGAPAPYNYMVLTRDFMRLLCRRFPSSVYCGYARKFTRYLGRAAQTIEYPGGAARRTCGST